MKSTTYMNSIRFNFLYIDQYWFGRTWIYPDSQIPYNMLRYIVDGSAEFVVDGQRLLVKKGDIAYLPEGCRLGCRALEDNFSFYSIRFTTSVFYEGADFLREYYGIPLVTPGCEEMEECFRDIYSWVNTDRRSKIFHVRGGLELLISRLIDKLDQEESRPEPHGMNSLEYNLEQIRRRARKSSVQTDPRIQTVLDYIMLHPMEEYTSKRLSQMAETAETTFRRLFKEETGVCPTEFIRQLRLTTAARILLVTNATVSEVAYEVGFRDDNYFIRAFKKNFGMTPNQYRKTSQE